jgi:hypothetical protein
MPNSPGDHLEISAVMGQNNLSGKPGIISQNGEQTTRI